MDKWKLARRLEETNMQSVTYNYYEKNAKRLCICFRCKVKHKYMWAVDRHDSGKIQAQGKTRSTLE